MARADLRTSERVGKENLVRMTLGVVGLSVALLVCLSVSSSLPAQPAPATAGGTSGGVKHTFVCGDYTGSVVKIISAEGKVTWEYPARNVCDLGVMPNGNFLFTTGQGVKEVTRDKKVVFSYETPSGSEVFTCQRLADGNTLVGLCTDKKLVEVTPMGEVVREIKLTIGGSAGHTNFRRARKLDDGTYVVAQMSENKVCQYDATGKVLRTIDSPAVFFALPLPKGNLLLSCADTDANGSKVYEVDPAGKTVWEVKNGDLAGITLRFMAGTVRLANGNTLMCNWLGHGHLGEGPHLIEVTPEKKVVWTYADHTAVKTISCAELLDGEEK